MTNQFWYLVTIDFSSILNGDSVIHLIKLMLKIKRFNYVILDDLDWVGRNEFLGCLKEVKNKSIKLSELIESINNVHQFIWGDFFLFSELPKNWNNSEKNSYPQVIIQSQTTLRAIDGQYIYIYTPYKEIVDLIKENYLIENVSQGSLEDLEYPY